ncbi:hypothetical protein [Halosimplex pelagicum]|uniref:Uncharacterized protein n=1 Tax=Halosimplex pelagicum TaxID=869886 RepID=A0A7D5P507_9EURY|nr:hypothetical protein [Halosimplex pelagicum]QLH80997.1 hypothetical protein HZS54_04810 [Halosimplex pelagicum]
MASDLATADEVDAGEYTVRVAQTDDGQAWEAIVLSADSGGPSMQGMAGMIAMTSLSKAGDDGDEPLGPPVTAPHKWVAVGFAIEAYEWGQVGETPVDVDDGYDRVTVDGKPIEDASLEAVNLTLDTHATTFSGSWSPGGDDDAE